MQHAYIAVSRQAQLNHTYAHVRQHPHWDSVAIRHSSPRRTHTYDTPTGSDTPPTYIPLHSFAVSRQAQLNHNHTYAHVRQHPHRGSTTWQPSGTAHPDVRTRTIHPWKLQTTVLICCQPSGAAQSQSHVRTRTTTPILRINQLSAIRHSSPRRTHTHDTPMGSGTPPTFIPLHTSAVSRQAQLNHTYAHVRQHPHWGSNSCSSPRRRHTYDRHTRGSGTPPTYIPCTALIRCQPSGTAQSHVRTRTIDTPMESGTWPTFMPLHTYPLPTVRHNSITRTHTYNTPTGSGTPPIIRCPPLNHSDTDHVRHTPSGKPHTQRTPAHEGRPQAPDSQQHAHTYAHTHPHNSASCSRSAALAHVRRTTARYHTQPHAYTHYQRLLLRSADSSHAP